MLHPVSQCLFTYQHCFRRGNNKAWGRVFANVQQHKVRLAELSMASGLSPDTLN